MLDDQDDLRIYHVVKNHEEQYSIWFADRQLPKGWDIVPIPADFKGEGQIMDDGSGNKLACLAYIETIWTDMRPLSLRQQLDD